MNLFQLFFFIFALAAIGVVSLRRRGNSLGVRGMIFWILFWVIASLVVLWPESTSIVAKRLGIGRGTDFILYSSVALIFFLLFRLNIKIENMNRDVTRIVRDKALKKVKNNNRTVEQ